MAFPSSGKSSGAKLPSNIETQAKYNTVLSCIRNLIDIMVRGSDPDRYQRISLSRSWERYSTDKLVFTAIEPEKTLRS